MKINLKYTLTVAAAILVGATSAIAEEPHVAPIRDIIELDVREWVKDPIVIAAIREQNITTSVMSEDVIIKMDKQWRAETKSDKKPLIDGIAGNALSTYLKKLQNESGDLISEMFVMDAKGLNVGMSNQTSDYWQGDEAKWQKSFLVGKDALFIDEAEIDESTSTLQAQTSISITDPDTGEVIGAITVGFNLDAL